MTAAFCVGVAIATGLWTTLSAAGANAAIDFPDGYREWRHVKSGLIDDPDHPYFAEFGGLHHIYANASAIEGYRRGTFPNGAILVYDLHALQQRSDGSVDQGPRRHVDVMIKDAARFTDTGGWGYERFDSADMRSPRLTPAARKRCAACHAARASHDHVFSEYRP